MLCMTRKAISLHLMCISATAADIIAATTSPTSEDARDEKAEIRSRLLISAAISGCAVLIGLLIAGAWYSLVATKKSNNAMVASPTVTPPPPVRGCLLTQLGQRDFCMKSFCGLTHTGD